MDIQTVCVFCGSSLGNDPVYEQTARLMGRTIAEEGMKLVYGGSKRGLMGAVADGALEAGGHVIGVIPHFLSDIEVEHEGVQETVKTDTMLERKTVMAERSDAFLTMPGGFGTMDEVFEMLTWGQLGLHRKPNGLLNVKGYYGPLLAHIEHMTDHGFLAKPYRDMVVMAEEPKRLLRLMREYEPPVDLRQWIQRSEIG